MYTINTLTKESMHETMFEAALLLSSIPAELLTDEMKEKVDKTIWDLTHHLATLTQLKQVKKDEVIDIREFHEMD
jgi:hypothetical protein